MLIEPPSVDLGKAVERGDGLLSEQPGEQVAEDTADAVGGKDVEGIVDVDENFE